MDPTPDRRFEQDERVPLRIAVELGQGDFQDPFAADSLNLSKGGISMRAPCLPDVGSRLVCRFECVPGGAPITAQGEVVWAHLDGSRCGEFGLAFIDLEPQTEWMLDELIAEHSAHRVGESAAAEHSAPVSKLELEGSREPIAARLASEGNGRAVFEQELDLLSLGRAVRAFAPGAMGRDGNIAGVELRLVGNIPMLAVTVDFQRRAAFGEDEFAKGDAAPRDTEPDMMAPTQAQMAEPFERVARVTLSEFDAPFVQAQRQAAAPDSDVVIELAPPDPAPLGPTLRTQVATLPSDRDFSRPFVLEADREAEDRAELEAFSTPAWKPALAALVRTLGTWLQTSTRGWTVVRARLLPQLRLLVLRTGSTLRTGYARHLGPQFGAMRRLLVSQLASKRRRTTVAPGPAQPLAMAGRGRIVLVGLLAAVAIGLGVYGLAPSGHEDAVEFKRAVLPPSPPSVPAPLPASQSAALPSVAAAPEPLAAANPLSATSQPTGQPAPVTQAATSVPVSAQAIPSATKPEELPSAARVPDSSPFAVDLRQHPSSHPVQARAAAQRTLRFGAAEVRHGRRFMLRMSAPVQALQGASDAGGFSVVITGGLSLDRAGPISSSIKSVQRAMIINKGDRAELNIRFVNGKSPAYQVTAEGSTLYVVIEDA